MAIIGSLLTLPALGPPKLIRWLAQLLIEEAERQMNDPSAIRAQLIELQQRYEAGEISDSDFENMEEALFNRLEEIREAA